MKGSLYDAYKLGMLRVVCPRRYIYIAAGNMCSQCGLIRILSALAGPWLRERERESITEM